MNSITSLSPQQFRRAADLQERILSLQKELSDVLGGAAQSQPASASIAPSSKQASQQGGGKGKRRLSPEGLAAIRAGVMKRQQQRAKQQGGSLFANKNSGSSASANKSRSDYMKQRWATARASGKSQL